jgi:tyrosinase
MSIIVRQNIDNLTNTELAALRQGFSKMQGISDNRGYNVIAGYHGLPLYFCYHHENRLMFLPWHRGYLLTFEHLLRDQLATLALPYWDWTSPTSHATGVPKATSAPKLADNSRNPLYNSYINVPNSNPPVRRWSLRFPGNPRNLPAAAEVQSLLAESDYETFANGLQDIHDGIHGWVGGGLDGLHRGDMGFVPTAAYDPLFFLHHCMIDRIWQRWQELHGVNNIPGNLLGVALRGFDNLTVSSVLDISRLGYRYASDEILVEDAT